MIYVLTSSIFFMVSIYFFKKAAGTLNIFKVNLISFIFYYPLTMQSFIGVNIAILYLDNHYKLSDLRNFELRLKVYFIVLLTMVLMPLTMFLVTKILNVDMSNLYKGYLEKETLPIYSNKDSFVFYPLMFFSFLAIFAVIYVFLKTKSFGFILYFFDLSSLEKAQFRINVTRNFKGNIYLRNIFASGLTPFLTYIIYCYKKTINKTSYKVLFYLMFSFSIYILTYNLEKAPVLWFILGFLFLDIYLEGKIPKFKFILISVLIILFIISFYFMMGGINNFSDLFTYNSGPIGRILLTQITPLYYHFDIFPEKHNFLGDNFMNFIIPGETYKRSARIVAEISSPKGIKQNTVGVANTLFVGEAFANFGLIGILISIIFVGALFQIIFIYFLKAKKNPITVGVLGYLTINLTTIVTGGILDFIYNPILMVLLIISIIIIIFGKISKGMIR